ncbi:MAG: hypothetical protein KDE33_24460, partial [Bacteroidetes bacterium]|nr:hypothetical protein [Bacteroidota bacterium]
VLPNNRFTALKGLVLIILFLQTSSHCYCLKLYLLLNIGKRNEITATNNNNSKTINARGMNNSSKKLHFHTQNEGINATNIREINVIHIQISLPVILKIKNYD